MRKIATIAKPSDDIRRVMLYALDIGAYLFLYTKIEDGPCEIDEWYGTPDVAEQAALERFGICKQDWIDITDPQPGAQHDWIRPTRVKHDASGEKLWGQFEAIPTTE